MIEELREIVESLLTIDTYMSKVNEKITGIQIFEQTWGSTSLGFGGFGGSAMTTAPTTVITTLGGRYYVFFGLRIAYVVENPTERFLQDLANHSMADCSSATALY